MRQSCLQRPLHHPTIGDEHIDDRLMPLGQVVVVVVVAVQDLDDRLARVERRRHRQFEQVVRHHFDRLAVADRVRGVACIGVGALQATQRRIGTAGGAFQLRARESHEVEADRRADVRRIGLARRLVDGHGRGDRVVRDRAIGPAGGGRGVPREVGDAEGARRGETDDDEAVGRRVDRLPAIGGDRWMIARSPARARPLNRPTSPAAIARGGVSVSAPSGSHWVA